MYNYRKNNNRSKVIVVVASVVASVVVIAAGLYFGIPRTSYTSVESTTWEYTIRTRQKTLAAGEGWGYPGPQCNGFCEQPFDVMCETRISGTHSCLCNNQHVCQQCPTYSTWCKYKYYDWPIVASVGTGGHEKNTFWPEAPVLTENQRTQNVESYTIVFKKVDGNTRWTYEPNGLDDYRRFSTGEAWSLSTHPGFDRASPKKKLTAEQ